MKPVGNWPAASPAPIDDHQRDDVSPEPARIASEAVSRTCENRTLVSHETPEARSQKFDWGRIKQRFTFKNVLLVAFLLLTLLAVTQLGKFIDIGYWAQREAELKAYQSAHPVVVVVAALVIYAAYVGMSLPGSLMLTVLFGWYFGFVRGTAIVSFGSTAGASIAFLLCRYFFRDMVQRRFANRIGAVDAALQNDGRWFLLAARMIQVFPFFLVNILLGQTKITLATYWWTTQLGMLPALAVYVYAASRIPSLHQLAQDGLDSIVSPRQAGELMLALTLLGLLAACPWFLRAKTRRVTRKVQK